MEERLKHRLVGAAVLVLLAVVFVPIVLDIPDEGHGAASVAPIEGIPERPDDRGESSVISTLELPRTPRLDAEVERERTRQASSPNAVDRRVLPETPARVSVSAGASDPAAHDAPASVSVSAGAERPAAVPGPESAAPAGGWIVQLGSFQKAENAHALEKRLRAKGYSAFVESGDSVQGEVFRVFVGPMPDRGQAADSATELRREMKLEGIVMPYSGG